MMKKPACCSTLLFAGLMLAANVFPPTADPAPPAADGASVIPAPRPAPNRSPLAVALHPRRRLCATANHTAGSVSFVDLKTNAVLCEHPIGNGPADVEWIDEATLLVSLLQDDAVALVRFDRKTNTAKTLARIAVGDEPRGLALMPGDSSHGAKRRLAFVALTGLDQVGVLDLAARKVVHRIAVGGNPKTVAVSPDGKWLVTCCNVPGRVYVHDAKTFKRISNRPVFDDGFNLGRPVFPVGSSQVVLPHQINRTFPVHADNVAKGWVIDNRLTRLPVPDGKYWRQKQVGLDVRGAGAGDANAVACSPDGRWWVVSCGGSHELLVLDRRQFRWPPADPGDFAPVELREKEGALRRIKLGGRPVDVRFLDARTVVVANYLSNAVQIVDVAQGKLSAMIDLGGPHTPGLVRRGEALFYDADLSLDSWFSCHTCHTDGHTSGQTFDTLNDGNFDTYKLVPSLRGVTQTGPWTWHGWQKSLAASVRKSLHTTLHTDRKITGEDVRAMLAFLGSLQYPASPHRAGGKLTAAALRGKRLFAGKAGCANCHTGKHFTSAETYQVGLESARYFYKSFNPPALRGLHARRRFLHDGRAETLLDVLTRYHRPEKVAGEKLTAKEVDDLLVYLRSL